MYDYGSFLIGCVIGSLVFRPLRFRATVGPLGAAGAGCPVLGFALTSLCAKELRGNDAACLQFHKEPASPSYAIHSCSERHQVI